MVPLALLCLDFLSFAFLQQWLVYSTLCYLVVTIVLPKTTQPSWLVGTTVFTFLLHDFAMHGRFGLALIFLIPAWLIISKLKYTLHNGSLILITLSLIAFFVGENLILYAFFDGLQPSPLVTSVKIFINIAIGYAFFWGMQGNRALVTNVRRGRKVWTPNRMDASQDA